MKRTNLVACCLVGLVGLGACSHDTEAQLTSDGGGSPSTPSTPSNPAGATDMAKASSNDLTPPASSTPTTPSSPAPVLGEPIAAPLKQWTWIDVDGMKCGNGSASGIGVNLTDDSDDVLIFLEGGGACWDEVTCWGPGGTALYFQTGYNALAFFTDPQRLIYLLNRDDLNNPFREKNIVYIPYCTGDAFSGDNVTTMRFLGIEHETHFVGYRNVGLALERIAATLPSAKRVWLAGDSAGGFGAAFNFGRTQTMFPSARVDVIDDSGQPIMPDGARWQQWKDLWKIQLPADCLDCADGPTKFVDYYRGKYPASRFGLISFDYDLVIAPFMNLTLADFHDQLYDLASQIDTSWPNARYFILGGASHVGLGLPTGELKDWVAAMVTDDATWESHQP